MLAYFAVMAYILEKQDANLECANNGFMFNYRGCLADIVMRRSTIMIVMYNTHGCNFNIYTDYIFFGSCALMSNRSNLIAVLMSFEILTLAAVLNLVIFSVVLDDMCGQIFMLFLMAGAGVEASVGLALLLVYYRVRGIVSLNFLLALKG